MRKGVLLLLSLVIFLTGLFSYKLLEVPRGLTLDEAAFGYNGALIAKTARDENHRFMPLFVLSSGGTDWRQPVTQYYLAALFKIFGSSLFLLRFSSVLVVVGSIFALYFLAKSLLGKIGGFVSAGMMAMTPLVMIQSHMALDNIMPIPFTLAWLWGVSRFLKEKGEKWIVIMGASLGAAMYTYKGMRAIVPVWLVLTGLLIIFESKKRVVLRKLSIFGMAAGPFFLAIPWIEKHYPGAMMGGATAVFHNVYDFFSPYLSSFDISYWFVLGDLVGIHTTGIHGMYLLASAPWFFLGAYLAIRNGKGFFRFLLTAFILGPLLLGLVGSVHRYSRLMMMIPLYSLLVGQAVSWAWSQKNRMWKPLVVLGVLLAFLNFGDFLKYYWTEYPGITESFTGTFGYRKDFQELAKLSASTKSEAVISEQMIWATGESGKFFQITYFGKLLRVIKDGAPPEKGELLLSPEEAIEGAKLYSRPVHFRIFIPQ